jgi:YfiH family protein
VILNNRNGLSYFQFPNLNRFSEIRHGIFTRNGGRSTGPYRSLNTSFGVGDDPANVQENRLRISACMKSADLLYIRQVHGNHTVVYAKGNEARRSGDPANRPEGDALVTASKRKLLMVQVADCQSVFLYDPFQKVAANVHSGWRGSIKNVIGQTVKTMQTDMQCRARHIVAGVGPSLGPCCAEFINYKTEIPLEFWKYKDQSNLFDFWSLSRDQLVGAGVWDENIYVSKMCTKCNPDLFFSYRGEGQTGRFAAVIGLK